MLGLVQTTVFMSGVFAGTGTGIAAMKLVAEYRESNKQMAGQIVASSLSMTLMLSARRLAWRCIACRRGSPLRCCDNPR